jgi:hypothetical protein
VGCAIAGLPGHPIEGVSLCNVSISYRGGGTAEHMHRAVGECPDKYPEFDMFQEGWDPIVPQPSYGFFCRHVQGLRLSNIRVSLESDDCRPAILCEDVEDLEVFGLDAMTMPETAMRFKGVRNAMIHGCRARPGSKTFLLLTDSEHIHLVGNELSAASKALKGPR